jgi:hypothetical protein
VIRRGEIRLEYSGRGDGEDEDEDEDDGAWGIRDETRWDERDASVEWCVSSGEPTGRPVRGVTKNVRFIQYEPRGRAAAGGTRRESPFVRRGRWVRASAGGARGGGGGGGGDRRLRVHVEDVVVAVGAGVGRRQFLARASRRVRRHFPAQETPIDGFEEWVGFDLFGAV